MGTFIGLTIFVPIFFETSRGLSARESGLALIPFMVGTVTGATISGRSMARRVRYKRLPMAGLAAALLSLAALVQVTPAWPLAVVEVLLALVSLGIGTLLPVTIIAVQNAVDPRHLGAATASVNFFRQLGGAIIVAIFGAIAFGQTPGHGLTLETLSGHGVDLSSAFRGVFLAAAIGILVALVCLIAMEERPLRERAAHPPPPLD
jgi:MFS family permease